MSEKYKLYSFQNGLTLVVYPIKEVRAITLGIGLRGGSAYEKKGEIGTLHFLEHVLLSGNRKYKNSKQLAFASEKIGVTYNGGVSLFDTQYWYSAPDTKLHELVKFAWENYYYPLYSDNAIELSRNIILSEIDSHWDHPDSRFSRASYETQLGKKHPYVRRGFGERSTVETMTREKLVNTHKEYYIPSNTFIVIVGNVSYDDVEKVIQQEMVFLPSTHTGPTEPKPRLPAKKSSYLIFDQPRNHIRMGISFMMNKGSRNSSVKERLTLGIINYLLGGGRTSLLNQVIREDKGLVYNIGTTSIFWPYFGCLEVWGKADSKNLDKTFDETIMIIKKIKKNGFAKQDFKRVHNYLNMRTLLNYASVDSIANNLMSYLLDKEEILLPEDYVRIASNIDLDFTNKSALEILDFSKMSLHMLGSKELISKTNINKSFDKIVSGT